MRNHSELLLDRYIGMVRVLHAPAKPIDAAFLQLDEFEPLGMVFARMLACGVAGCI